MERINNNMTQAVASRQVLDNSQEGHFPYDMNALGLTIQVNKGVFSPKHFNGWKIFTENFPQDFEEKTILEVGTGTGVTALYLAKNGAEKVVAVDINQAAVENARINATKNNVDNMEVRYSDIFSNVGKDEKFDIVYWNMPFMPATEDYEYASMLERGLFDPGYQLTDRFLREARDHLEDGGRVLVGTGEGEFADIPKLLALAKQYGYDTRLLVRKESSEINPVAFRLYELTCNQ